MTEVAKHRSPESCWLAVRGKVYDVTSFVQKHPGGVNAILRHGGEEATEHFDFHSRDAQKQWAQFQIGVLEGYKGDSYCRIS
jgi:cytochrome b involved in lipid metabolism